MEEATHCFQKFGLTKYESSALAALFSHHDATAQQVSEIANIPYTKVYGILNSLENHGLLRRSLERPKKYSPISAEGTVNLLFKRKKEELKYLKKRSETDLDILKETHKKGKHYGQEGSVTYLPTLEAVSDYVDDLYKSSKKSIFSIGNKMVWTHIFSGPENQESIKVRLNFLKKGGILKNLTSPVCMAPLIPKFSLNHFKFLTHSNFNMRFIPELQSHPTIVISDESKLEMSFLDFKTQIITSGIIINNKQAINAYLDYFNMLWNNSNPMPSYILKSVKQELQHRGLKL